MTTMPHRALGTSGLLVSAVGWSTRALARPSPLATPAALVRAALDAEIDLFDSTPDGDAQDTLARTLRGKRPHVALGARCVAGAGAFSAPGREWRPEEVRARLELAMRQLQTDWLDVWILHHPPAEAIEDDDLWAQLAADHEAGWVRVVGVAAEGGDEARMALRQGGLDFLVVPLNLAEVEPGRSLAAESAEQKVAVVADDPLSGDGGSGRLLDGLVHPDTERTPVQGELAGVLSLQGVSAVLSPAVSPSEIAEQAGAAAMPLSDSETRVVAARLDEARESQREP